MARPVWTLTIGSTTKTLAEWGLMSPRLSTVNLGRDVLTAETAAEFDASVIAPYGTTVKLYRDGVKWFDGESFVTPRSARGASERQSLSFVGPWNFLERNVYKTPWFRAADNSTIYTSHLIFPINSVAAHITNAINYAISRGANMQLGTITAPIVPPSFEVTDITIAGAIIRLSHYAPDCIGWFDYSTTPPTFHFQPRSVLTTVPLTMPTAGEPFGSRLEMIEPVAREDLQVDNVALTFEITSQVDGEEVFGFYLDHYPPATTGLEDGCMSAVINLQGFSATTVQGTVIAETIDTSSLTWWQKAVPALNDARVFDFRIVEAATRAGYQGEDSRYLPRRLIDGQAADWMVNPDGTDIDYQKEVITCTFEIQFKMGDDPVLTDKNVKVAKQQYQVELTSTNAPDGETSYSTLATFEDGDARPIGMAEYLYNSLNALQYDAQFVQHKSDCDGEVTLGCVVNLENSAESAWNSMRALVQQVSFDIDRGVTEIVCGPARHLSIDQILELLRVGRIRRRWTNPSTQTDGSISARNVELGKATANNNAVPATPEFERFVVKSTGRVIDLQAKSGSEKFAINFGDGQTLTLEKTDTNWTIPAEANRALALREVCVKVAGVSKKMLVIGSVPYD